MPQQNIKHTHPSTSLQDPTQLDIAFVLSNITRDQLFQTREIAVDALVALLPEAIRRKARHMIAAAYVKSMFVSAPPRERDSDVWASFSLHSLDETALQLTVRFVAQSKALEPVQLVCTPAALQSWLSWQPSSGLRSSPLSRFIPGQCIHDAPLAIDATATAAADCATGSKGVDASPSKRAGATAAVTSTATTTSQGSYCGKVTECIHSMLCLAAPAPTPTAAPASSSSAAAGVSTTNQPK